MVFIIFSLLNTFKSDGESKTKDKIALEIGRKVCLRGQLQLHNF